MQSVISEVVATQPHYSQITDNARVNAGVFSSPQTQTLSRTLGLLGWVPSQINMEMPLGIFLLVH